MKIAVTTTREADENLNTKAEVIAKELEIPFISRGNLSINKVFLKSDYDYLLITEKDKLVIKGKDDSTLFWHPNMAELKINSIRKGNREALSEACCIKEGDRILDCTLGLGSDSLVLAAVTGKGGSVVGTEINKYIAYLTKNGLEAYKNDEKRTIDYTGNIEVVNESYENYLGKQEDSSFDIVYFDPMFKNPNKKSTTINTFRSFADHRGLTKDVLAEVLRVCRKRVVIKERYEENDLENLGVKKFFGGKRKGSIIYGVIEKNSDNSSMTKNNID